MTLLIGPSDVTSTGNAQFVPPMTVNGHLDDFLAHPIFPPELVLVYELEFFNNGARVMADPTFVHASSVLQIFTDYTFTPAQPPPAEVPEPATGALVLLGLSLLWPLRRGRR